jgi:hypothetical protein
MKPFNSPAFRFGILAICAALLFSSCKKDRWIDDEEAAAEVESALAGNNGGLAHELDLKMTYVVNDLPALNCGQTASITRTFVKTTGSRTGEFTYTWLITKQCSAMDTSLVWDSQFNGVYDAPRSSGSTMGVREWIATNVGADHELVTLNGTAQRSGSHELKIGRNRIYNTAVSTTYTNLIVDKATRRIIAGTAVSQINIAGSNGGSYDFTANITFNNDGTATFEINGQVYEVELYN